MGRKCFTREFEFKGFKGEILGASRDCALFINGTLYERHIKTLTEARFLFNSYVRRKTDPRLIEAARLELQAALEKN